MSELTILITMVGAQTSPDIIDAIKNNGDRKVRVIGVDPVDHDFIPAKFLCDAFYHVPKSWEKPARFVHTLLTICEDEGVDLILPCGNEDCLILADYHKKFENNGIKIVGNEFRTLKNAFNKIYVYNEVEAVSPNHAPKWGQRSDYSRLKCVVKPIHGRGGRGVYILDNDYRIDLSKKPDNTTHPQIFAGYRMNADFLMMEYLPGDIYSVYCLCNKGETLLAIPNKRIYGNASNTIVGITELRGDLIECVKKLNKSFNFTYNVNYEFALDEEGVPKLFDLNPRLAASTAVFRNQGINLPWMSVLIALGEYVVIPPVQDNYVFMRYLKTINVNPRGEIIE